MKRPRVLLLDEPLSALDAKLREAMRLELVNLRKAVGITFVFVTHDQDEALSMADRIAVMEGGRVRQIADPATLYEYPNCRFVAGFIGEMNLFEATVGAVCGGELVLDAPGLGTLRVPHGAPVHGKIGIAVRPEKIRLSDAPPPAQADGSAEADPPSLRGAAPAFEATVEDFAYYGSETRLYLVTGRGMRFTATVRNTARGPVRIERGARRFVSWAPPTPSCSPGEPWRTPARGPIVRGGPQWKPMRKTPVRPSLPIIRTGPKSDGSPAAATGPLYADRFSAGCRCPSLFPGPAHPGNAGVSPANGTARPPPIDAGETPAFPGCAGPNTSVSGAALVRPSRGRPQRTDSTA